MEIDFMMKYAPLFAKAAWTTLGIGATGIFLSFLAGLVISVIQYRKIPFLLPLSTAYVELSRNTPLLVQLFFLYFGLPKALAEATWRKPSEAELSLYLSLNMNRQPPLALRSIRFSVSYFFRRLLPFPFLLSAQTSYFLSKKPLFSASAQCLT